MRTVSIPPTQKKPTRFCGCPSPASHQTENSESPLDRPAEKHAAMARTTPPKSGNFRNQIRRSKRLRAGVPKSVEGAVKEISGAESLHQSTHRIIWVSVKIEAISGQQVLVLGSISQVSKCGYLFWTPTDFVTCGHTDLGSRLDGVGVAENLSVCVGSKGTPTLQGALWYIAGAPRLDRFSVGSL